MAQLPLNTFTTVLLICNASCILMSSCISSPVTIFTGLPKSSCSGSKGSMPSARVLHMFSRSWRSESILLVACSLCTFAAREWSFVMLRLVLTSPQMAKLSAHFVIWTPFTSCTSWSVAEAHVGWLDELICKYEVVYSSNETHCTVFFQFIHGSDFIWCT